MHIACHSSVVGLRSKHAKQSSYIHTHTHICSLFNELFKWLRLYGVE